MEIIFGIGAYDIRLGMRAEDVIRILGMPDKINIDDSDELYEQNFVYNKQMLVLWFERENRPRVSLIQCFSPDITINGEKVLSKSKKEIKRLLRKNGFDKYEEIDEFTDEVLFYEDMSAWFNFKFDKLIYIEFSMLVSGDDIYWPYIE